MRIIGIDPGYERLGLAILEKNPKGDVLLFSDCIRTSPKLKLAERVFLIGQAIDEAMTKWEVDKMAIEKLFFTTNQKTAMGVSEVIGAACYIAGKHKLKIVELTPLQIKIAITGYGKATKDQVVSMLSKIIKIPESDKKKLDDEYDAIAVGVTALSFNDNLTESK